MITKNTLRYKAYRAIKDKIIFLQLKPGDKIVEAEIAKKLKVSRTPVREALVMLENERLVQCDSSLGYIVRSLTNREISEYFAIRKALELFAVPLITERITNDELKALRLNIAAAEKAIEKNDLTKIIRCETDFHNIQYKATKSEIFFNTISGLTDKFQLIRAIIMLAPSGANESVAHHKQMLIALEKREPQDLARLIERHLKRAAEKFADSPAGFFLTTNEGNK